MEIKCDIFCGIDLFQLFIPSIPVFHYSNISTFQELKKMITEKLEWGSNE
jgi:hypothetical protein